MDFSTKSLTHRR